MATTEVLSPSPKSDLKVGTIERIARLKKKALLDGINVEKQDLSGDRRLLESYRTLKADFMKNAAQGVDGQKWEAVMKEGQHFRHALAKKLEEGRATGKGE
jgi:hypothetical protein